MSSLDLDFKNGRGGYKFFCSCGSRFGRRKDLLEHMQIMNTHAPIQGGHFEPARCEPLFKEKS